MGRCSVKMRLSDSKGQVSLQPIGRLQGGWLLVKLRKRILHTKTSMRQAVYCDGSHCYAATSTNNSNWSAIADDELFPVNSSDFILWHFQDLD